MTTEELWRAIPGWEGYYSVSNRGRVRSEPRIVTGRPGVPLSVRGRELSQRSRPTGHRAVWLCRENTRVEQGVHQLVLLAFVGPCPPGLEGCHGDGDPSNNCVSNLRWDTRSANTHDKVTHGHHPFASRTECPYGHPYDTANTYFRPGGGRTCRTCRTNRKRAARAAQKETR